MKDPFAKTKKNYEDNDTWHQEKSASYAWTQEAERFAALLPKGARVLDIGSGGSGRDIKMLTSLGFNVDALDYSHAAVASLKDRFPSGTFYEADMRSTGLPDGTYDGIWACASLLNISKEDVPQTLLEFRRLLKGKGALFVSVKRGEGEKMVPDRAGERFFNFFSELELRQEMATAGFKVKGLESVHESVYTKDENATTVWLCIYALKSTV